ncbi:MAG: SWIM zinc finger family protein [Microcystis sp.]
MRLKSCSCKAFHLDSILCQL